jgi:moderate conductance mechanosensitive channel
MVLRLLIASFILLGTINMSVYGSDEDTEDEFTVEDVTPEMLASTLPPQEAGTDDDAVKSPDTEDLAKQDSATKASETDSDPKLRDVIRILETEADRANLVATLKTLTQSNALPSQQFMFVNMVVGIKDFLRSVVAEFKTFVQGLTQKNTWKFNLDTSVFNPSEQAKYASLAYLVLAALFVQGVIAKLIGGAISPFFGKLDRDFDIKTVMRTFVSVMVFFLVAYVLKAYLINDVDVQTYIEDSVLTLLIVQIGFMVLRLSIATGVLPVNPEYRKSLVGTVFVMTLLWGGYGYVTNLVSNANQMTVVARPLSQLFWGALTLIGVGVLNRYRHVVEGMLFRKNSVTSHRLLGGVQQVISGSVHYVVVIAVVMVYFAWFVKNAGVFQYFQDQLGVTIISLLILSIASAVMESSAGYLSSDNDQHARISAVTHRLIDVLAFITVVNLVYRWLAPLAEMQGISTSKISDKLFGIFIIVALTVIVMHGLNRIFNGSSKILDQNKHLKTFVPILDRLSKLVVLVISGLLVLIELNVNVMPIVASFSVLGLGIGLASKSIIEDFMNGLLIIQENDFNIGDKITIGGITGTIENVTLRKLHLRDSQGFMNFIPFSNVGAITNQSRDYNNDKITIPLPSAFHLKRTVHILEDVGKQLLHDPDLKAYIIAIPKFIGVSEFQVSPHQNSEITTMMQFELKTTPGSMSLVAGEFRKLAKLAFEEMERIL